MRMQTTTPCRSVAAVAIAALLGSAAMAAPAPQNRTNRPPNAPTLVTPAANTRLAATSLDAEIQLHWRNNGDPDRDAVHTYLETMYWDVYTRTWKPAVSRYVSGTSTPVVFKGSPGAGLYIAWRLYGVDAAKRSNPWFTASAWRTFHISFPSQQPPPRPLPPPTGFDFGTKWEVWGYHTGTATWTRYSNSANTFQAIWKDKQGKRLTTTVTLTFSDGKVHATSKLADGKAHTYFYFYLDENIETAKRMRAVPRKKKLGGMHHQGHGNGWTATATVIG